MLVVLSDMLPPFFLLQLIKQYMMALLKFLLLYMVSLVGYLC